MCSLPDHAQVVGFQVVGYDNDVGKTIEVNIGKDIKRKEIKGTGCTVSGQNEVVRALWRLRESDRRFGATWAAFSLQDAIDYAEFAIRTTADVQRFSQMIPGVGGDIDVALVTPFDGFRWIKQKHLSEIVDRRRL